MNTPFKFFNSFVGKLLCAVITSSIAGLIVFFIVHPPSNSMIPIPDVSINNDTIYTTSYLRTTNKPKKTTYFIKTTKKAETTNKPTDETKTTTTDKPTQPEETTEELTEKPT